MWGIFLLSKGVKSAGYEIVSRETYNRFHKGVESGSGMFFFHTGEIVSTFLNEIGEIIGKPYLFYIFLRNVERYSVAVYVCCEGEGEVEHLNLLFVALAAPLAKMSK